MSRDPFLSIWIRPRQTVRSVVSENPALHVHLLACLTGIGQTLDRACMRNAGDKLPLATILVSACVLGPLGGLLALWVSSHLIRWTGTWIGGTAALEHVKTAVAWASVPAVFSLLLWIPELVLMGPEMFTKETPRLDAHPVLLLPFLALMLAEMVLSGWSVVLLCHTIAEVQGYRSAWRGLGNLCLAGLVILVPLLMLIVSLVLLTGHR